MALRHVEVHSFTAPAMPARDPVVIKNPVTDCYLGDDLCRIGKILLWTGTVSLGVYATLRLVGGGIPTRFLAAVKWTVSPQRFHSPITLYETELLTGFKRVEDRVYQIEKVMTGSHERMLAAEPLAEMITEASTWQFCYKARAETIRFLHRADGSISLSFVDVGDEAGQVVFGVGTPWHRFLVDNQTLWEGRSAGRDHCWLAERLATLMTAPGTENFIVLQGGQAVLQSPAIRGVTGHPISAIMRIERKGIGRGHTYGVKEADVMRSGWDTEIDPSTAYLSTPIPGWWKVSFGHKPFKTDSWLNGSVLVREETCSGRMIETLRPIWVEVDEGVYRLPQEGFEAFLVTLPRDNR